MNKQQWNNFFVCVENELMSLGSTQAQIFQNIYQNI